jgi:hypothetical protein
MKNPVIHKPAIWRTAVCTLLLILAGGCTSSLKMKVEGEVPTPVVTRLPLKMGVYYDDKFSNYTYKENSAERRNWSIESGASQVAMFQRILPSMFTSVQQIDTPPTTGNNYNVDAILVPNIEEMQFSLPSETKLDLYEVWIKYQIGFYDNRGRHITDIPLTAYGKTSTAFMLTKEKAMQAAMDQALRDAGARLALGFTRNDDVRRWLKAKGLCGGNNNAGC